MERKKPSPRGGPNAEKAFGRKIAQKERKRLLTFLRTKERHWKGEG